jgi:hypothetical protein
VCEFYCEDPYIEVEGSFHRLNSVGLEVMDGWAAIHVAGRPLLSVSTDSRAATPCGTRLTGHDTKPHAYWRS